MSLPRIHLAILEKLLILECLTSESKEKAFVAAEGLSGEEMEVMLKRDFGVTELEILVSKSLSLNVNPFCAKRFEVNRELFKQLDKKFCEKYKVLPVSMFDKRIVVAIHNPFNLDLIQEIKDKTKLNVSILLALEKDIEGFLNEEEQEAKKLRVKKAETPIIFQNHSRAETTWMPPQAAQLSGNPFRAKVTEPFLKAAYEAMVDMVLVEPDTAFYKILYHLDTKPLKREEIPYKVGKELIDDIRKLANIEGENPEHPRESVLAYSEGENSTYYFRITYAVLNHHQSLLLEPVKQEWVYPKPKNLGMKTYQLNQYEKILQGGKGLVLHVGSFKSGLTTTLYAGLNWFEGMEKLIRAVDSSDGFLQLNAGVIPAVPDYGSACRAALRQMPEVLMIGDTKDEETAKLALEAAMCDNLVFTGVYGHSAVEGMRRMLALGANSTMLAKALKVACAQKLLKKLCEYCKEPYTPEGEDIEILQKSIGWYGSLYKKSMEGCSQCNRSGWHGHVSLFEFMFVNEEIGKALREGKDEKDLLRIARKNGMRTLHEESMDAVKEGLLDMEYVLKHIPPDFESVEIAKKAALAMSR